MNLWYRQGWAAKRYQQNKIYFVDVGEVLNLTWTVGEAFVFGVREL